MFRAKTEEDLKQLERLEVPIVTEAIVAYREVLVDPEFQELERLRSDALHNEASALLSAEYRKARDIAKNLFAMNMPIEQIAEATGLTIKEIETLQDTDI